MSAEAWNNNGIHPKRGEMSVLACWWRYWPVTARTTARTIRELRERFSAAAKA